MAPLWHHRLPGYKHIRPCLLHWWAFINEYTQQYGLCPRD